MRRRLAPLPLFLAAACAGTGRLASGPVPASVELSPQDHALAAWLDGRTEEMTALLKGLVEVPSGTADREGLDRLRGRLGSELAALGFSTGTVRGGRSSPPSCAGGELRFADHLLARREGGGGRRVLLMGHLDTVFPREGPFRGFKRLGSGGARPGAADMKGGLVVMLYALKSLHAQGLLDGARLTVLLNTDEEVGSLGSRLVVEEEARRHDAGLVFEPSSPGGLVRTRKGLGQARLVVRGRGSHAGSAHSEGVSAVHELARKVVELEKLTDYGAGVTVNVGLVSGGEARNTVPPCAEAQVDLRFPDDAAGRALLRRVRDIARTAYTENERLGESPRAELWDVLHRPPKPATPASDALLSLALGLSSALGRPAEAQDSGGGTDGSLSQAVGLPTLDSLGPEGSGAHSSRETVDLASLPFRAKLAAFLLRRLLSEPPAAE